MAAPTFVAEAETVWNTSNDKTTGSITVQSGDVLVAFWICESNAASVTIANSGTAQSWTERQQINLANYTRVYLWTAVASVGQSMTVTFDTTSAGPWCGGNFLVFRASDGVGATTKTNVTNGAPSLGLTTTQDNSAIVVVNGDWAAVDGASRTWRTVNSITPTSGNGLEVTYFRDSARYVAYGAYYSDAGTTGAKTVGLSAPGAQTYSIAAVEVKGTAGAAASRPIYQRGYRRLRRRW